MVRSNLLFLHVLSAMFLFAALGAEALALTQIRRAPDPAATRPLLGGLAWGRRLGTISMAVMLLSGLYLATTFWHWKGRWMGLGFLGLLAIAAVSRMVTGRIVDRLRTTVEGGGPIDAVRQSHATLRSALVVRLGLLIAVAYLMTTKPG